MRTGADDHDPEVLEIAEERRGADEGCDVLRVPDVAGVHDEEAGVIAVLARPGVVPGLRRDAAGVDPVLDHANPLRRRTLGLEPLAHRLSNRDDPIRAAEVGLHHQAQQADQDRVLEALQLDRDLGEHVLGDDDQRNAEAAGDEEPDVADHRRVGEGEHDVGALERERAQDAVGEVGGVVDGAEVELRPVERRRTSPEHAHPVEDLVGGKLLVIANPAGHDRDLVLPHEPLAQLCEQVRGRLDARPVVLVEHKETRLWHGSQATAPALRPLRARRRRTNRCSARTPSRLRSPASAAPLRRGASRRRRAPAERVRPTPRRALPGRESR